MNPTAVLDLPRWKPSPPHYMVGTPAKVRDELLNIARELEIHELIINTIAHSHEARKTSYALLAEAFDL